MSNTNHRVDQPRIVGRSSSHFTRVLRMFAEECGVPYEFQVVSNLLAVDSDDYGGNPGLRLPNLVTSHGAAFGSLPACRLIASMRPDALEMVWPEQSPTLLASNATELAVQAMATEVTLIMVNATSADSSRYAAKLHAALGGILTWLDQHVDDALLQLPPRDLSYLELSLFCLIDHLEFREVMSIEPFRHLRAFRDRFAERPSAIATPFEFDAPTVGSRSPRCPGSSRLRVRT